LNEYKIFEFVFFIIFFI